MESIHTTAIVKDGAQIDPTTRIGPYAVIGSRVRIQGGCRIGPHVVIQGETTLGRDNEIAAHVVLGGPPQIRKEQQVSPAGQLIIGHGNSIREFVTIHAGLATSRTRIGDHNYLMAYSHVAHDCELGSHIELTNGVQLAGHVRIEDHATLGGMSGIHQFVRVGRYSFVGAGSMVSQDVLPYTMVSGDRAATYGLNVIGLRRHRFSSKEREGLARAVRFLLEAPTLREGLALLKERVEHSVHLDHLLTFAQESQRGICRGIREGR